MAKGAKHLSLLKRAITPAVTLVISGYFASYAIAGDNGLLAWGGYSHQLEERKVELADLEAQRDRLRQRSHALSPKAADPDLADELVRRDLGLIRDDEVILPLE